MSITRVVLLLSLGLSVFLHTGSVAADKIPGTPYAGPWFYFATEMDLIEFSLWPDLGKKTITPPVAKFTIPRAYIFFVAANSGENLNSLSSAVDAKAVGLMFTYPDGLPYSHAVHERVKKFGISARLAGHELRSVHMTARIYGVGGNAYRLPYLFPEPKDSKSKRETYLGTYSGLKRYTTGEIIEIYYASETALIRKIRCRSPLTKADPREFCKYHIVLNRGLVAKVDFVDFRVHGGLKFAEERVRAFKATVCRYVSCDDNREGSTVP